MSDLQEPRRKPDIGSGGEWGRRLQTRLVDLAQAPTVRDHLAGEHVDIEGDGFKALRVELDAVIAHGNRHGLAAEVPRNTHEVSVDVDLGIVRVEQEAHSAVGDALSDRVAVVESRPPAIVKAERERTPREDRDTETETDARPPTVPIVAASPTVVAVRVAPAVVAATVIPAVVVPASIIGTIVGATVVVLTGAVRTIGVLPRAVPGSVVLLGTIPAVRVRTDTVRAIVGRPALGLSAVVAPRVRLRR